MKCLGILAAIAVTSCAAGQQQFEPTERVQGSTLEGDNVSIYPLAVATGQVGDANVWSSGADKTEGGGTVVRIGIDVHNTGSAPIYLRPDAQVLLRVRNGELDLDAPGARPPVFGYPLAWCFAEGGGRVFSTSLGHFPGAWETPAYLRHLAGGLEWALGPA